MQPHDRLFCEIAVQLELLTREQVADCMRTLQSDPRGRNIGSIAASLGFLTREQVDLVLANQQRVLARRREARAAQRARREPTTARGGGAGTARALQQASRAAASAPKPPEAGSARSKEATPTTPWQQRNQPEPALTGGQRRSSRGAELLGKDAARETFDEKPLLPRGLSATVLQGTPPTASQRPIGARSSPALGPRGTQLGAGAVGHERNPLGAAAVTARPNPLPDLPHGGGNSGAPATRGSGSPGTAGPALHPSVAPGFAQAARDLLASAGVVPAPVPANLGASAAAPLHASSGMQPSAVGALPPGPAGVGLGGTLLGASALAQSSEAEATPERAVARAQKRSGSAGRDWRNPSRPPPAAPSLDAEPEPVNAYSVTLGQIPSPLPVHLNAPVSGLPGFLDRALKLAQDAGASDLHLHSGSALFVRIDGKLWPLASETPFSRQVSEQVLAELLDDAQRTQLTLDGELRFTYEVPELGRFRAHAYCQERGIDLVLRLLPAQVATPEKLGLAAAARALREHESGLCLFTGPSGAGKSTSLAALLKTLAGQRALYSVSLEDPIEIVHTPSLGVIEQREVGRDVASFAQGVDAALRMGADVIVVDDVAEPATLAACLRAARGGCLVLAGLRASSGAQALARLLRDVEASQLERMRFELAQGLRLLFHQRLLPRARTQGRVLALESIVSTPQLTQAIREDKLQQLAAVMAAGKPAGMVQLDDALDELVRAGTITVEAARHAAHRRDRFKPS